MNFLSFAYFGQMKRKRIALKSDGKCDGADATKDLEEANRMSNFFMESAKCMCIVYCVYAACVYTI